MRRKANEAHIKWSDSFAVWLDRIQNTAIKFKRVERNTRERLRFFFFSLSLGIFFLNGTK